VSDLLHLLPSAAGWTGALLTTGGYALVSQGRVSASSRSFQGANALGAVLLTLSAVSTGAWPSAAANVVWLAIGGLAFFTSLRAARAAKVSEALTEA
jgi:hypothetical protein